MFRNTVLIIVLILWSLAVSACQTQPAVETEAAATSPVEATSAPTEEVAEATSAPQATESASPEAEVAPTTEAAAETEGEPKRGGILRVGIPGTPGSLDPHVYVNTPGYFLENVYQKLVRMDHQYQLHPELATSWESPDSGLTWVFNLREGVRFHHGLEFTAEDVLYSFNRLKDPDIGSPDLTYFADVELSKTDDHTIKFTLTEPNADFPYLLGQYYEFILPHDEPVDFSKEMVGTGPFKFVEVTPGEEVILERNEDYWEEDLPYLDGIRGITIPESATMFQALKSGDIDVWYIMDFTFAPQIEEDANLKLIAAPATSRQGFNMMIDVPPFDDNRVRQALKLLIDRQVMCEVAVSGYCTLSNDNPIYPANPYWMDTGVPERDVEKAKALLAEAGYVDGLELVLWSISDDPRAMAMALAFQEQAKEAGIQVEIQSAPGDTYWSEIWLKEPFGVVIWSGRPTADMQFRIAYTCEADWNETHWCHEDFDQSLDEALSTTDDAQRKEIYAKLQQSLVDEGGSIIAYFGAQTGAIRANVQGYNKHPQGGDQWKEVWLDE